ncbi:MAG: hypothetical protein JW915_06225 [Chitinispirillaceae bacterium]|nr:hypothetical protein [Chitinispirillaceae bacterium]
MNKKGTTLLEIIIYISLFTIVSIFIGTQVNSLVKAFSGGTKMSTLQGTARDALAVMAREIKNTGFKSYLAGTTLIIHPSASFPDRSSFIAGEGNPGDTLTIVHVHLEQNGTFSDTVRTKYFLNGTDLCKTTNNATTILSNNIFGLQFQYGILGASDTFIQQEPIVNNTWSLTGGTWGGSPGVITTTSNTNVSAECQTTFSTTPCRLSIQFRVEPNGTSPSDTLYWKVVPGYSSNAVGSAGFKPSPLDNEVIIPVNALNNGKIVLSFKKVREGSLVIKHVMVRRIDRGAFSWTDLPSAAEKQFVKAIRINILSRSAGKTNTKDNTPVLIGNETIPRDGPYSWRINTVTVEIPNNGLF